MVSVQKAWGMELHFPKRRGNGSNLQLAVSEWKKNKVMVQKVANLWKVDPKKKVLCMVRTE